MVVQSDAHVLTVAGVGTCVRRNPCHRMYGSHHVDELEEQAEGHFYHVGHGYSHGTGGHMCQQRLLYLGLFDC